MKIRRTLAGMALAGALLASAGCLYTAGANSWNAVAERPNISNNRRAFASAMGSALRSVADAEAQRQYNQNSDSIIGKDGKRRYSYWDPKRETWVNIVSGRDKWGKPSRFKEEVNTPQYTPLNGPLPWDDY